MSKNTKRKKSTTKNKKNLTSRVMPVIAFVEVLVLIAVTTFAWYFFSANKTLSSGIITVNADSGLEIDFKDADKNTFIDVFDYIDKEKFYFEPATSVDGRNIYFPTSGTFGNTDTASMVFRDGTVNDINSKYVNIDFELTNTTNEDMDVYLSHKSFFEISNDSQRVNGKALRLALYNNDGNSGNVASNIISNINKNIAAQQQEQSQSQQDSNVDEYTIHFNNSQSWDSVSAFVFDKAGESESTKSLYSYTDDSGTKHYLKKSGNSYVDTTNQAEATEIHQGSGSYHAWPGVACARTYTGYYSYTFDNPYKTYDITVDGKTVTYTSETERLYDSIIFNNGSSSEQTVDITGMVNGRCYTPSTKSNNKWNVTNSEITMKTVYFLKPTDWGDAAPYCKVGTTTQSGRSGGTQMTEITTAIYSFTFPSTLSHIYFYSGSVAKDSNDRDISSEDNKLYYFPERDTGGEDGKVYPVDYSSSSIYFYNDLGWSQPYAHVNAFAAANAYTYPIAMIKLSQNLYYCPLGTPFLKDEVAKSDAVYGSTSVKNLANNCQVYFTDSKNDSIRTVTVDTYSEHVYRVYDEKGTGTQANYYLLDDEDYSDEVEITKDSYAVISPGVSAGFQRSANPVNKIDYTTGAVQSIVPTFASSFDDFLMGSDNPVFRIAHGETVHMSMIIWLEGTDLHCTQENYAGKDINLYLEFSTVLAGDTVDSTYTYRFIDETREHWTSDTITNSETNVTVSPVMQLYDASNDRGYLMHAKTYTTFTTYGNGTWYYHQKVLTWECVAPQSLITQSDGNQHNIEFRRVNPYDESQVWDRWEAGDPHTYMNDALELSTRSVNFTAFANGSPEADNYPNGFEHNGTNYSIPTNSCGGLWGRHATDIITVYDGRKDRNIGADNGCLNLNFTYTYPQSNQPVDLELKASNIEGYRYNVNRASDHTGFYEIIVPEDIYDQGSNVTFRNYRNLNDGDAIDSIRNKDITLEHVWKDDTFNTTNVGGPFFEINTENGYDDDSHCYWGSDVIYTQVNYTVGRESYDDNTGFNQAKFYTGQNDNEKFYSYLYNNDFFKGSVDNVSDRAAFVAVVPVGYKSGNNEIWYSRYSIERCKSDNHNTILRKSDNGEALERIENSESTPTHGRILVKAQNSKSLTKIKADKIQIYYNPSNWSDGRYQRPSVHIWGGKDGSQDWQMGESNDWVDGKRVYTSTLWSNDHIKFMFSAGYQDDYYSVQIEGYNSNNIRYYPTGTVTDTNNVGLGYTTGYGACTSTDTDWDVSGISDWPKYRAKDIRA